MNEQSINSSLNALEELMGFFSDKKKSNLFFDDISYLAEAGRFFYQDFNKLAFFQIIHEVFVKSFQLNLQYTFNEFLRIFAISCSVRKLCFWHTLVHKQIKGLNYKYNCVAHILEELMNYIIKYPLISLFTLSRFAKSRQKSVAIVSSKVIRMIAQETQDDPGILSSKLKLLSPLYLQNQSRFEQLTQPEVEILRTAAIGNLPSSQSSTQKKKISSNYLKHLFSSDPQSFYNLLDKSRYDISLHSQDVLNKLKSLNPKNQVSQITEEQVNVITEHFTTGIKLPDCFSTQERIQQGKKKKQQQKIFAFNPTFTTTTYIFNHILQNADLRPLQLFTGRFGAGKTTSFILYCLLMDKVAQYAILSPEEVTRLVRQDLLVPPMKPLYWSIRNDTTKETLQSILSQCPEFKKFDEETYNQIMQSFSNPFMSPLRNFYLKRNVSTLMIIDQIEALACMYRTAFRPYINNTNYKQFEEVLKKPENQEIIRLNRLRSLVHSAGQYVIYNSSSNIQRAIFSKKTAYPVSMEIETHQKVSVKEFPYFSRIKKQKCIEEITANILFEAKLREAKVTQAQQGKVRELIKNYDRNYLISPLEIHSIVSDMGEYSISLVDSIKKHMSQIRMKRKDRDNFLRKIRNEKEQIHIVLAKVLTKLNKSYVNGQQIKIKSQQVYSIMTSTRANLGRMVEQQLLFDRNWFQLTLGQDWRWIIPDSQFQQFYKEILKEFYPKNIGFFLESLSIQELRSAFGILYELAVIESAKKTISKKKELIVTYGHQRYCINKICQFMEFNSQDKEDEYGSEVDNFVQILDKAKENPLKFIFGIPTRGMKRSNPATASVLTLHWFPIMRVRRNSQLIFMMSKPGIL